MKRVIPFTLALVFAQASAHAQTTPAPAQGTNAPAPGVTVQAARFIPVEVTRRGLKDLGGREFRLSDYAGRVYVLNLWATWCVPCRLEIPGFNQVYEEFKGRGVEFVGLTTEDPAADGERVRDFVRELPVKYRVGWLDRESAAALMNWSAPAGPQRLGRFALPQTFVLAADGHVVLRVRGYNPKVPEMIRNAVQAALSLPPAEPAPSAAPPAPPAPAHHP